MLGYEIKQASNGEWYVILRSLGNHETLMKSEEYIDKRGAQALVEILRKAGLDVIDITSEKAKQADEEDDKLI